jgi:hypothetical protein
MGKIDMPHPVSGIKAFNPAALVAQRPAVAKPPGPIDRIDFAGFDAAA